MADEGQAQAGSGAVAADSGQSSSSTADASATGQQTTQAGSGQAQSGGSGDPGRTTSQQGDYDRQIRGLTGDLQRERKARQEFERQVAATRAELESERRRVQALAGVAPQDPQAADSAQVREAFLKMFPQFEHLLSLDENTLTALAQVPQLISQGESAAQQQSTRHADQQMVYVNEGVAQALGVDTLDADQASDLRNTFSAWLQRRCQQELQESGGDQSSTLDRYERGDQKLLDEFTTAYTKRWVAPARRQQVAQAVNRARPVPNSGGRTMQTSVQRPAEFKSLDDRIAYAAEVAKSMGVIRGER